MLAAMVAAVAMIVAFAGVAFADGGPHGGYGQSGRSTTATAWSDTDGCAGCHRAHSALNDYLLVAAEIEELCKSCHAAGAGASTDVWAGEYMGGTNGTTGHGLNGGGFDFAARYAGSTNTPTDIQPVTSKHNVGQTGTAWGGGMTGGSGVQGPGYAGHLECTSCHNPHGSNNYRILNATPASHGSPNPAGSWVAGAPMQLDGIVLSPEIERTAPKNYTAGLNAAYDEGISDFCASCHTNYLLTRNWANNVNGGVGQMYDYGDGEVETWRHSVASKYRYIWDSATNSWTTAAGHNRTGSTTQTQYPFRLRGASTNGTGLATPTTSGKLTCLSCHFAHGTAAQVSGYAAADTAGVPGNIDTTTGEMSSALLFLDNRGVCQNCHNKKN